MNTQKTENNEEKLGAAMKKLKNDEIVPDINTDVVCPNCFSINESVYNTLVADFRCQKCGDWFMGEKDCKDVHYTTHNPFKEGTLFKAKTESGLVVTFRTELNFYTDPKLCLMEVVKHD